MACGARESVVTGRQQEVRVTFVVVADGTPLENAMATATFRTKAALVNVVLGVAGRAVAVAGIAEIRVAVTRFAGNAFVTADQSKPGHRKVIESSFHPVCRAVTIRTLATVSSFVNVIGLMAGNAGTCNVCEVILFMAGIAGHAHVPTAKRKASALVIEFRVTPAAIVMARRAVVAQLSYVHIVRPMAVDTSRRRVSMRHASSVTVAACNKQMCSVQREIRKPVIETFLVKVNNVLVTTLMIAVTACAIELLRLRKPAVEAGLLRDVATNFRVANDTQFTLRLVRQWCVAGPAFCLDFLMTGDDWSGHDQPLFDF